MWNQVIRVATSRNQAIRVAISGSPCGIPWSSVAISAHERTSSTVVVPISRNQSQSVAISRNQSQSVAISRNQRAREDEDHRCDEADRVVHKDHRLQ